MTNERKKPRPKHPPLEPLAETIRRLDGSNFFRVTHRTEGTAAENFAIFARGEVRDLASVDLKWLEAAYLNAFVTDEVLRSLGKGIEEGGGTVCPRATAASLNVLSAITQVSSAIILLLREGNWYGHSALSLLRTSLELATRGGAIALGTAYESARFMDGEEIQMKASMDVVAPHLLSRDLPHLHPARLYKWLNRFSHFDATVMESGHVDPTHVVAAMSNLTDADRYAEDLARSLGFAGCSSTP